MEDRATGSLVDVKRRRLRGALEGRQPVVVIGAHDAMSARLIERAGFDAVWVSGFGVSTMQYALPDINLVTMSELLETAIRIDTATALPVIADCDNGFGAGANLVRTLRAFEHAGIAGICVEDNAFPKRNSLFNGATRRALVPLEEQSRRIRLALRERASPDFLFIARTEALIAGEGVEAALLRAEAYVEAGADAILIQSRDASLGELETFLACWSPPHVVPLVAVTTLIPRFSARELHERGFDMVIMANQLMRVSVHAMEGALQRLTENTRASSVDPHIAPVSHIFELVDWVSYAALDDDTL